MCYVCCWHKENKVYNNLKVKKEHVIELMKRLEEMIRKLKKADAIRCLERQNANAEEATIRQLQ